MARPRSAQKVNQPTKVTPQELQEVKQDVLQEVIASHDVVTKLNKTTQKFKKTVQSDDAQPSVYHYKLTKKNGLVYFLQSSGLNVYDKESGYRREIRYAENERSVFAEEQGDFAVRKPIKFRDGELYVPQDMPSLRNFLDIHPDNVANGGHIFYRVDRTEEAKNEVEETFKAADAVIMVREKSLDELMPVILHYGIDTNRKAFEIKRDLLIEAKRNPNDFMKRFDSPLVKLKAIVQNATDFNIIDLKEEGIYWFDSQQLILTNPVGKDPRETMAVFLTTERGLPVLENLQEQLSEI